MATKWRVGDRDAKKQQTAIYDCQPYPNSTGIALVLRGRWIGDEDHNANLIAKAPELRDALSALVHWMENDPCGVGALAATNHAKQLLAAVPVNPIGEGWDDEAA